VPTTTHWTTENSYSNCDNVFVSTEKFKFIVILHIMYICRNECTHRDVSIYCRARGVFLISHRKKEEERQKYGVFMTIGCFLGIY
jgi:hypothetical protein